MFDGKCICHFKSNIVAGSGVFVASNNIALKLGRYKESPD